MSDVNNNNIWVTFCPIKNTNKNHKYFLDVLCATYFVTGHIVPVSSQFNPLKTEFLHSCIYKSSPYHTENTLRLHYKAQPVNAV
jgi:hypothetical protein